MLCGLATAMLLVMVHSDQDRIVSDAGSRVIQGILTGIGFLGAGVIVNIALSVGLFFWIGFVSIAIATSIAAWLNTILLWAHLARHGHLQLDALSARRIPMIFLSTAGFGVMLWGGAWLLGHLGISLDAFRAAGGLLREGGLDPARHDVHVPRLGSDDVPRPADHAPRAGARGRHAGRDGARRHLEDRVGRAPRGEGHDHDSHPEVISERVHACRR